MLCNAMIMNHVVQYVTVIFTTLNNKYDSKHSPRGQMEEYRRTAWSLFKNLVESKTEDMEAVGFCMFIVSLDIVVNNN
jgi:CRISPR/Cas system type I-B associated protein Csh2 (Cas7 group RAMP superfamily)